MADRWYPAGWHFLKECKRIHKMPGSQSLVTQCDLVITGIWPWQNASVDYQCVQASAPGRPDASPDAIQHSIPN